MSDIIILPFSVACDDRLTKRHIRVLLALYSYRNRDTNLAWPSRKSLSRITGYDESRISVITGELVKLGWLVKDEKPGVGCEYRITVPPHLPDERRELDDEPVTKTVTPPVTKTVTPPVTKTVTLTNKELNKELNNKNVQSGDCTSLFDMFWAQYPVKRNKKKAKDIWRRKRLDRIAPVIIDDVIRRKQHDQQWLKGYIPHPTTYLNGERWEDELTSPDAAWDPMDAVMRLSDAINGHESRQSRFLDVGDTNALPWDDSR